MRGQHLETAVGAERIAFASEHARDIFVLALELKHARGKWKIAGQIFAPQPVQQFAMVCEFRKCYFRQMRAGQSRHGELGADFAVAHFHHVLVARIRSLYLRPAVEQGFAAGVQSAVAFRNQWIEICYKFVIPAYAGIQTGIGPGSRRTPG